MRYRWYGPTTGQELAFFGAVFIALLLFGVAALVTWGDPFICYNYGCASFQDYTAGALLCAATICSAVALFMLPVVCNCMFASLYIWAGAIWIVANSFHSLHPSAGPNPEEFAVTAFKAVATNDRGTLIKVLRTHPQLARLVGHRGNTLLHQAVARRKDGLLPILIAAGVPVNQTNEEGMTALDLVQSTDHEAARSVLVASGGVTGSRLMGR